jgi:hypothetical protein
MITMWGKIVKITLDENDVDEINGIVYKVNIGNKYYIGSTKNKLNERENKHNFKIKNGSKTKFHDECIKNNIYKVKCIELYRGTDYKEIENKIVLESLNDKHCLNMKAVISNKERRKEQRSVKGKCELCGVEMLKKNLKRHKQNFHKVSLFCPKVRQ